ncbi:hypothetical protein [Thermogemmatispora sp.]|uniref:hypothetical protein n=1 Tax=Thermogemmatispora sp. TaxID=1968838 RepID=UPI0035E41E5F
MTGSLERPTLRDPQPGKEPAAGPMPQVEAAQGERGAVVEKQEEVEEKTLLQQAATAAEADGRLQAGEINLAEATLKREAVAAPRQEQEALVVPSLEAVPADHREDTLPLKRPAEDSSGSQAAFHSAPTLPVLPQEPPGLARHLPGQSRGWRPPGARRRPSQGTAGGSTFTKLSLAALIASLLLLLASLGLLVYLLSVLAAREGLPPASLISATVDGKSADREHGQGSATIELALFPQTFSPANCLPDNGYRCTATLMASGPAGSVRWQAWAQGVAARFNPGSGSIEPGQQQQVIIYLPATCPVSGKLIFSWNNRQLSVPWSC